MTLPAQSPPAPGDLFAPLQLARGPAVPNRLMKSAMSEALASPYGHADERLATLYGRWARGGAGLLVTGNVMVDARALGEPGNVVVEDASALPGLRAWADAVHAAARGTVLWMQLNHPGKQSPAVLSAVPVAPSAVPLTGTVGKAFAKPRALEHEEVWDIVRRFGRAAALAEEAGFHGVQIHGAHGYLVSQFLSPHHNRRDDDWGGSAEKRRRFLLEIIQAVRASTRPDFQVGVKLNSADFQRGGFTEDESLEAVVALEAAGVDLVEVSGGTYERPAMVGPKQKASTVAREAYFLEFAAKAKAAVAVPVAVTGGFRSGAAMQGALADGATDLIGMARPLAVAPDLPDLLRDDPSYAVSVRRPSTGFKLLDTMFMLDISWFEGQLARMAAGGEPDADAGAYGTVWHMARTMGRAAFTRRRA